MVSPVARDGPSTVRDDMRELGVRLGDRWCCFPILLQAEALMPGLPKKPLEGQYVDAWVGEIGRMMAGREQAVGKKRCPEMEVIAASMGSDKGKQF